MGRKNKGKKQHNKRIALIVGLVVGIPIMLASILPFSASIKGVGEGASLVSGTLSVEEEAADEAMGISDMGIMLVRKTEMYQYVKKSRRVKEGDSHRTIYYADAEFSEKQEQKEFRAYQNRYDTGYGSKTTFQNPDFPEELASQTFYGTVTIGKEAVRLDQKILDHFMKDTYAMPGVQLVEPENLPAKPDTAAAKKYGLALIQDNFGKNIYAPRANGDWKVGDIRITYQTVDPKALHGEYTALGELSGDGTSIGGGKTEAALYPGVISMDEASSAYSAAKRKSGFLFLLGGLAAGLLAGWITWFVLR